MTATPLVMPETPEAPNDALSDLLDGMRLSGVILFRADFRDPWRVKTPEACELGPLLRHKSDHIIPFHVIAEGGCWIEMPDAAPVWLNRGDAVLLPFGDGHCLAGRQGAGPVFIGDLLPLAPSSSISVVAHGGAGALTSIICGFLRCDALLFDPVLRHLPKVVHVRPNAPNQNAWLASTIRHTVAMASAPSSGARSVLPRITELMFVEILRQHMYELSADEVGWFAAYNDPVVGQSLRLLHAAPLHDWSVEELAQKAGASRTVLAQRFKHFLDKPPMQYLTHWRLRLAAQRLKSSDKPLKSISEEIGYESEAAFSRAFKRHFGLPPGDWRKRQANS